MDHTGRVWEAVYRLDQSLSTLVDTDGLGTLALSYQGCAGPLSPLISSTDIYLIASFGKWRLLGDLFMFALSSQPSQQIVGLREGHLPGDVAVSLTSEQ